VLRHHLGVEGGHVVAPELATIKDAGVVLLIRRSKTFWTGFDTRGSSVNVRVESQRRGAGCALIRAWTVTVEAPGSAMVASGRDDVSLDVDVDLNGEVRLRTLRPKSGTLLSPGNHSLTLHIEWVLLEG